MIVDGVAELALERWCLQLCAAAADTPTPNSQRPLRKQCAAPSVRQPLPSAPHFLHCIAQAWPREQRRWREPKTTASLTLLKQTHSNTLGWLTLAQKKKDCITNMNKLKSSQGSGSSDHFCPRPLDGQANNPPTQWDNTLVKSVLCCPHHPCIHRMCVIARKDCAVSSGSQMQQDMEISLAPPLSRSTASSA